MFIFSLTSTGLQLLFVNASHAAQTKYLNSVALQSACRAQNKFMIVFESNASASLKFNHYTFYTVLVWKDQINKTAKVCNNSTLFAFLQFFNTCMKNLYARALSTKEICSKKFIIRHKIKFGCEPSVLRQRLTCILPVYKSQNPSSHAIFLS